MRRVFTGGTQSESDAISLHFQSGLFYSFDPTFITFHPVLPLLHRHIFSGKANISCSFRIHFGARRKAARDGKGRRRFRKKRNLLPRVASENTAFRAVAAALSRQTGRSFPTRDFRSPRERFRVFVARVNAATRRSLPRGIDFHRASMTADLACREYWYSDYAKYTSSLRLLRA